MKHKFIEGLVFSTCTLALISAPTVASSQQSEQNDRLFDKIVVTAQKREQNAQDVPITINTFSGDDLKSLGLTQSDELGLFVPGLELAATNGAGSQLLVFLRGAGLNDFNSNNAGPIGIYSDEVYISSPILTSFQFFDANRVEVLRGPQGTLYGRNTTGGAVKFVSNKPTDTFEFSARGGYSRFDTTDFEAAISGPISDKVRARAAISKQDSDGLVRNLLTGNREGGVDTISYRGIIDIDVTDNFSVRGNIHGAGSDSEGVRFAHVGVIGGADALGYSAPDNPFTGSFNEDTRNDLDAIGGYIEAKWDLGFATFTSISAYDDVNSLIDEETDASPLSLVSIDYGVDSQTFTQELRLAGETERVNWLLGGFYLTENLEQEQTIDLFGELRAFTGGLSDPTGAVVGAPVLFARSLNDQDTETYAVFAQADFEITDKLTLTLGGRYTDEERTFDARGQLEDAAAFGPDPIIVYDANNLQVKSDEFSWRFGFDYAASDTALLFGSIARGFKSGGFNGGFLSLDPTEAAIQLEPYEPEFLTAYELGVKSELLDKKLRLNASVFYNDFNNLQVFTLVNTSALPLQVLDNASGAEVYGFEFETVYYPINNLLFSLSGALMDSKLTNFVSNAGLDFSGNKIALTPDASLTGLVRYDHNLSSLGNLYGQGVVTYKSDVFFSTENNPLIAQNGYALINLRLGFQHSSDNWEIAAFVNNLTDKTYITNSTDLTDFGLIDHTLGNPRVWGAELSFKF